MKKIVLIGPESTGKTTLARKLSTHFRSPMVDEYARTYIAQLERPYSQQDLLEIARGQIKREASFDHATHSYLFCDTDLRVIKIWSQYKYNTVHPWILNQIDQRECLAYLLTDIDLPWEPDPQREHPQDRKRIFGLYLTELEFSGVPFTIISGEGNERLKIAVDFIEGLA